MKTGALSYLCIAVALTGCIAKGLPKWPNKYMVQGVLELPYAEIKEPFTAYYDGDKNMSRIDYYGEMVITIQIGKTKDVKYGQSYKIAPMTTENLTNQHTCFLVNGTQNSSITIQTVLPDTTNFKPMGKMEGEDVEQWQMVTKVGLKKNTYTLLVESTTKRPIKYIMMGYDSLLGSHYDKYIINYTFYNTSFSDEKFDIPKTEQPCSGFPGPGQMEHEVTMNPMREYIHNYDSHTSSMFSKFKVKHQKNYKNTKEEMERIHIFRQNVRYIHSKNRAGLGYYLSVNHLADLDNHELKRLRGYRNSRTPNNAVPFNIKAYKDTIPDQLDWRLFGAVTPVKDQAVCGSCWSFGTTGTIEGAWFMHTNELIRLSQQELMDCSWGEGNNACDGGEDFRAYEWIKQHGLATEEDYGPYLAQDGYCKSPNVSKTVMIKAYGNVTTNSVASLKVALTNLGPISIAIDAAHKSLSFYSHGVYFEEECKNGPDDLDHAVLAVGYGTMNGVPYWLVKNSWSTYWGNDGYVLMSQRNNMCGVLTDPTYVII